jgi:hypothetical protein
VNEKGKNSQKEGWNKENVGKRNREKEEEFESFPSWLYMLRDVYFSKYSLGSRQKPQPFPVSTSLAS